MICQGRRSLSYIAAYSVAGVLRLMTRSIGADAVVDVEDLLPRLAAVDRPEDAALLVPREQVPHRRDVDDVRLRRVNDDARDVVRVGQAHELPGRAGVGRLEDALARVRRSRVRLLAGAHPDDVRVRRRERDRADGSGADAVGDRASTSCRRSSSSTVRRCASPRRWCRGDRAAASPAPRSRSPTRRCGTGRCCGT